MVSEYELKTVRTIELSNIAIGRLDNFRHELDMNFFVFIRFFTILVFYHQYTIL